MASSQLDVVAAYLFLSQQFIELFEQLFSPVRIELIVVDHLEKWPLIAMRESNRLRAFCTTEGYSGLDNVNFRTCRRFNNFCYSLKPEFLDASQFAFKGASQVIRCSRFALRPMPEIN